MNYAEDLLMKRRELIDVANAILIGNVNLIEGVRKICDLRFEIEDPDNEVFLAVRGVESETDHFPIGAIRSISSPVYLQQADSELESYLTNVRATIHHACREIIKAIA